MKTRAKFIKLLTTITLCSGLLFGCNSSDNTTDTTEVTATEMVESTTVKTEEVTDTSITETTDRTSVEVAEGIVVDRTDVAI